LSLSAPFHRLAWSNLAAQSAEQMALAASPIIAVLAMGAGAAETGILSAAQTLPFLLLSLPAGVLADRMRRRRLMAGAELLRAVALLTLPVLLWAGMLSLPLLALVGALTATGTVVYSVAAPALVPGLVARADFGAANTRLELARSLAFTAGPSLAGLVVAWLGGGIVFILAAILSLAAVLLLAGIPEAHTPPHPERRIGADLAEGLAFVRAQPLLRAIMATAVVWNVAWFVLQSVYVLYAIERLGLDAAGVGFTLGAFGAGMLCGATTAPALLRRMTIGRFIACGPLGSVAAILVMLASRAHPGLALPMLSFFLFGYFPIMWTIGQTTLRQAVTPQAMLGRVSALFMMVGFGARPVGAALGGFVGASYGLDWAMLLATFGFVVQAVIVLASPIPALRALPALAND
jgi:predicted MFS family arabinose efflux permease